MREQKAFEEGNAQVSNDTATSEGRRSVIKGLALAAGAVAVGGETSATVSEAGEPKPAGQAESVRGSEKLLERLGGKGMTYSAETLGQVLAVAKKHEVQIKDWCQFGQPAVDGVCGTFDVRTDLAANVLTELLKLDSAIRLRFDVFPLGMPAIDFVRLRIGAGRTPGM
jgi:hypothetical protein